VVPAATAQHRRHPPWRARQRATQWLAARSQPRRVTHATGRGARAAGARAAM